MVAPGGRRESGPDLGPVRRCLPEWPAVGEVEGHRQASASRARVETADIRRREDVDRLLADEPDRILLLAAQASRPLAERIYRHLHAAS